MTRNTFCKNFHIRSAMSLLPPFNGADDDSQADIIEPRKRATEAMIFAAFRKMPCFSVILSTFLYFSTVSVIFQIFDAP